MLENQRNKKFIEHQKDFNCFTIIVGKNASATGNIIIAHNEEDPGFITSFNGYVPPKDWPKGSLIPAEKNRAKIPQLKHTFGYYWTEFVSQECGLSSSDSYYNDNGVLIVSNGCNCSKEDLTDDKRLTEGGIEGNLRRIIAERANSAKHALEIAIQMVEKYGYVPASRAYTFADNNEVYMIQIVSGKHYMAVKIPDNMVAVMPNHYTLHKLKDFEQAYIPKDLMIYAIKKGWYKPQNNNYDDFDFIKVYADDNAMHKPYNIYRTKHAFSMLLNKEYSPSDDNFPFGCYLDYKISTFQLIKILASHYENTNDNINFTGPGNSPHHSNIRRLCSSTTIHSLICEFNDDPLLTRLWTCPTRPCSVPFLPHHPHAGIPKSLNNLKNAHESTETHYYPAKKKMLYEECNWQKFKDFANKFDIVYCDVYKNYEKFLNNINKENEIFCTKIEKEAIKLKEKGEIEQAKKLLCDKDEKCIIQNLLNLDNYEKKYFNICKCSATPIILNSKTITTLTFTYNEKVIENSLVFGISGTDISTAYANCKPGTLKKLDKNQYTVEFDITIFLHDVQYRGIYACILGGRTSQNKSFGALVLLECK